MLENASFAQQNVTNETMCYYLDEDYLHVNTFMISGIKNITTFESAKSKKFCLLLMKLGIYIENFYISCSDIFLDHNTLSYKTKISPVK